MLTPGETESLFGLVRELRSSGGTVVFISHKLPEVLAIADRITVMRQGRNVATVERSEASVERLTELMIGGEVPAPTRAPREPGAVVLEAEGLTVRDDRGLPAVRDVSLNLAAGRGRRHRRGDRQRPARALRGARRASAAPSWGGSWSTAPSCGRALRAPS